jgi:YidC/Oxa1 family membrane protein insertase
MNFDRNTVIGFVILAALFFGYFYVTNKEQAAYRKKKMQDQAIIDARNDSIRAARKPVEDSIARAQDSITKITNPSVLFGNTDGAEKLVTLQNDLVRIIFSNKGGQIKRVELKNFKGQDSLPVKMAAGSFNGISYSINTGTLLFQKSDETANLYFSAADTMTRSDGSKQISFTLASNDSSGRSITHEYVIKPNEYLIDFTIKMTGADQLLTGGAMNLTWKYEAAQQESDLSYERQNTQVGFVKDGSFDYHTIGRRSSKEFKEPVSWIGIRQRFFFAALVADKNFSSGKMEWVDNVPDSAKTVVQATAIMKMDVPAGSPSGVPLQIYFGPADYHILKKHGKKFDKLINLGQGPYAFVRPINKFLILPVFDFFNGLMKSPGLAIVLLTLFIRLLISPLTYSSYLSGAKMKALRPEISKLKEKFGEDRQAMSMEQMKLFREAGVNPLGGCIPALLQIPIFFALFSFFNSEPALRGAEFLWSKDLAAYDDPVKFGFNIPLLGSHLSLFNVLASVTSFLISWYSMSMTPDQGNPVLKYMPYIFPVFLLFFFNRLPSGLTWYYTVSNIVTLGLQFVIQNYIINHDKILAKIEENRKKPKTKTRWQERLEQMQEQQKRMKEMQQRNRR